MAKLFRNDLTLDGLNHLGIKGLIQTLGIEFFEIGEDYLRARMPVDERTVQPFGILHGGASAALSETMGSAAATFCCDPATQIAVGLELNANHIRSVRSGYVTGTTRPIHVGKSTQVWETRIEDDLGKLVCVSRLTLLIKEKQVKEKP